ncbi:hypothetical protein BMS3Bbin03_00706 [bacterium BMS3Bbin03]|nr:hypothetical protein BMS3Bbin03_00706 [bacterium BMS3Bbin03]
MMGKNFDLQDRLINFAVRIIKLVEYLPNSKVGNHIRSQIIRSGTSPASNYGEAQSAESRSDFVHKLKISLKELRETEVWLKIVIKSNLIEDKRLEPLLKENNELISILFKSIQTAKQNKEIEMKNKS